MKKSMILLGMLSIGYANAQEGNVGINTEDPKATLHIEPSAENLTKTTNEGIIAPKLTKARIAGIADANLVEGTLVYATDATYAGTNTKVAKITEKGYYFYNGTEWVKVQYKDTNDAEWEYDDTTKRINLKRSGQITGFTNKVYYDVHTGHFHNGNLPTYEEFNATNNTISTVNYISGAKYNIYNKSSDIVGQRNSAGTFHSKTNSNNYLVVDEKDISLAGINETRVANGNTIDISANHTSNLRSVSALTGSVNSLAKSGNKAILIGISGVSAVRTGNISSTIYSTGLRGESYWNSTGNANQLLGAWLSSNMGADAGNAKEVTSAMTITRAGGTGTIDDLAGIINYTGTYAHFKGNLTNLYGMKYTHDQDMASSKPENHYGIYIGDVSAAKIPTGGTEKDAKNFAIYSNAGKIRVGDLADTSATADRAVVVDKDGVLKVGTSITATNGLQNIAAMECNATNRGKMNFIPSTDNAKSDVFGICMRNKDGNYYWAYMVGGNNPTNGTGTFGSGL